MIRRGGGNDDALHRVVLHAGIHQGIARRLDGHVRGGFFRRRAAPFPDAGEPPDLLVRDAEAFGDLLIGQASFRQIAADAANADLWHGRNLTRCEQLRYGWSDRRDRRAVR